MRGRVTITGGAGFIGSHLAAALLERGYEVTVLDNLEPQVHGQARERPPYLHEEVRLITGDLTDSSALAGALEGAEYVVHLAARVGVAQSMYQVADYTRVNNLGTAMLLERLIERPVKRLLVASSMSVYGEGLYRDAQGRLHDRAARSLADLRHGRWEPHGRDGAPLEPIPTPEAKTPDLQSVYALSKFDQERLCMLVARAYGIPAVALRFFNVYGPHQALSNPYTGALAIFAARLMNDRPPVIFEDGGQRRDFVNVSDVARACVLALETDGAVGEVFNIGSGEAHTVLDVARMLARALGKEIEPEVTGVYRVGDIRHCFADIAEARSVLGYGPEVDFARGIEQLVGWLEGQAASDHVDRARAELESRRLTV